ncbi:hypothetical protein ABTM50_19885, partial [Acinetobacter baumannii]
SAALCGVSLAVSPGEAVYIPVGHCPPNVASGGLDFGDAPAVDDEAWRQCACHEVIERLKPLLEDPAVLKVAHNAKYDLAVLARYGIRVAP